MDNFSLLGLIFFRFLFCYKLNQYNISTEIMKKLLKIVSIVILMLTFNANAQVKNGDMEQIRNATWPWNLVVKNKETSTPGSATMTYEAYSDGTSGHFLQVVVKAANMEKPWNLRVRQGKVKISSDATKITFKARGIVGGEKLKIRFEGEKKPEARFTLTNTWQDYELVFPASLQGSSGTISFWTMSEGTYQLDDVSIDK